MKVSLLFFLLNIFAYSIPEVTSELTVSKHDDKSLHLETRDETYSYVSVVNGDTSYYGQLTAWAAFGVCSLGWASSVYKAYQICENRVLGNDAPPFSCHDAVIDAAQRTVLTGAVLAVASAKRGVSLDEALEMYQINMGSNRTNLSIVSISSDTINKRFESSSYNYDIVVQNNDLNSTFARVIVNNEKIGSYELNNIEHAISVHKRADVCYEGQKCTEAETEYFGDLYIASDICKDLDFEIYDGEGDWLSDTIGHLYGTGDPAYCADYYKIYTVNGILVGDLHRNRRLLLVKM